MSRPWDMGYHEPNIPGALYQGPSGRSGIHPRLGKKGTGFSPYIHHPPIFLGN